MKYKSIKNLKTKRPKKLIYFILGGIITVYAIVFKRQKVVSTLPNTLKAPYIVIGNHTSFYDFIYAIRYFFPHRINFVVARKYFFFPMLSWILKISRSIPKSLYQVDYSTVKGMLDVLNQGGIVGIYPEGQISMYGITLENSKTLAKLVKKAGVPVVSVLTGGGYFCNPPWTKAKYNGVIESNINLVLTANQVKELTINEIDDFIQQSIYLDNFQWLKNTNNKFKSKNKALGMDNLLYICPKCKKEFQIVTEDDGILCESCGNESYINDDGQLHWKNEKYFNHIGEWYLWQVKQEKNIINSTEDFFIFEPVELTMIKLSGKGVEKVGKGIFSASKNNYTYTGTLRGENVELNFSTSSKRYLPFEPGYSFQIYHNNLLFEFIPNNRKWSIKIACICEALKHT